MMEWLFLAPVDSTECKSVDTGHRGSCANQPSSNHTSMSNASDNASMSNASNNASMSNASDKSTMSDKARRHNTNGPHPVGADPMGGTWVVRDSGHWRSESLGLGHPPVLTLQRLRHRLVGDLTTSNLSNSHSGGNNSSADERCPCHKTTNCRVSCSNKTASHNTGMDGSHKSVASKTSNANTAKTPKASNGKSRASNKSSSNNSGVDTSHKAGSYKSESADATKSSSKPRTTNETNTANTKSSNKASASSHSRVNCSHKTTTTDSSHSKASSTKSSHKAAASNESTSHNSRVDCSHKATSANSSSTKTSHEATSREKLGLRRNQGEQKGEGENDLKIWTNHFPVSRVFVSPSLLEE